MRVLGILQEKRDLVMKNGDLGNCDPGCVNLSFCVEGESFIMALFPGSTCTCASLQPMLMLNALSAQDDVQEVFHYTLEKTVQEVRIVRYNPPLASPLFSSLATLHTELLILVLLLVAVLSMLLQLDRPLVTFLSLPMTMLILNSSSGREAASSGTNFQALVLIPNPNRGLRLTLKKHGPPTIFIKDDFLPTT